MIMITKSLNIFNIRQMLSAFVLSLTMATLVLTLFSVEKIAFAETAEVTPSCASLLSSGSSSESDPLGQQLTPEEISQHVNGLADMYLNLFHGPNASQKNNFLSEEMIMQKKLAECEAKIPDISTRLSRVVEKRLPQFQEAMLAKEHEKAERLRESEEQLRELQKLDVCNRTPQVRDEIMRQLGGKNCEEITLEDLKKITMLHLYTYNNHDKISVLNQYDFYGLSSLEKLNLNDNQLSVLPEGVFAGLSSLEQLELLRNANFNFEIGLLKNLKTMKNLWLPSHLKNSSVTAELRKLLPGTRIDFD